MPPRTDQFRNIETRMPVKTDWVTFEHMISQTQNAQTYKVWFTVTRQKELQTHHLTPRRRRSYRVMNTSYVAHRLSSFTLIAAMILNYLERY